MKLNNQKEAGRGGGQNLQWPSFYSFIFVILYSKGVQGLIWQSSLFFCHAPRPLSLCRFSFKEVVLFSAEVGIESSWKVLLLFYPRPTAAPFCSFAFYCPTCAIWTQLPATATATWDLRPTPQLRQLGILDPLSEARDWTRILMDTTRVYYR